MEADKYVSVFPMIDDITDDFICKVTQTTIQGKKGEFYGSVRKSTGLPSGEGVFVADKWIYFGRVKDGKCFVGETLRIRRASDYGEYWIINANLKADGTLLEKVQTFHRISEENGFYVNKKWTTRIKNRLNFSGLNPENWLALWNVRFGLYSKGIWPLIAYLEGPECSREIPIDKVKRDDASWPNTKTRKRRATVRVGKDQSLEDYNLTYRPYKRSFDLWIKEE